MFAGKKSCLIAVAMTASMLAVAGPAEAVTKFSNCTQMHKTYKYGVARSDAAANRQQRTDHYRPAVRPKVYRANTNSDRDKRRHRVRGEPLMGLTWRRTLRVGRRSRLNLSASGASLSRRQGPVTLNSRGRGSIRLPSGSSYRFKL